jgi:hypothetical protein
MPKASLQNKALEPEGGLLAPSVLWKGGEDLVTYSDMFLFCTLIVSVISLMLQIYNSKKK